MAPRQICSSSSSRAHVAAALPKPCVCPARRPASAFPSLGAPVAARVDARPCALARRLVGAAWPGPESPLRAGQCVARVFRTSRRPHRRCHSRSWRRAAKWGQAPARRGRPRMPARAHNTKPHTNTHTGARALLRETLTPTWAPRRSPAERPQRQRPSWPWRRSPRAPARGSERRRRRARSRPSRTRRGPRAGWESQAAGR